MAKILKFKSKRKTAKQIQTEDNFKSRLLNTFPIEKTSNEQTVSADTSMEIDEEDENFCSNESGSECEIEEQLGLDQDNSQDYSQPSDDEDPSDDEYLGTNKKRAIPDEILWEMCKTGVSFNILSKLLKLGFSVLGERENFHL